MSALLPALDALLPAGLDATLAQDPATAVLAVLAAAVQTVLEVPAADVGRGTALVADLGADSLALVEIVEIVEETLAPRAAAGFHIDDDDLVELVTIGDAVDYAVARL